MNRLDRYQRLVQEGRSLEPAVDFARYVIWCGIIQLLEQNPQASPLKVDGAMLRWKAEELQRAVTERFRLNDTNPHLAKSELETLHDKLDKVAGYLSRLTQAPAVVVDPIKAEADPGTRAQEMQLSVIPGGLDEPVAQVEGK